MRYILLSLLCLSMNALSAGQGVTKSEEPAKSQPETPASTEQRKDLMPGELNHYEDDDVVDQPDYLSEDIDPTDIDPITPADSTK